MAVSMKNVDTAFHGVSHKASGMQIWRMESSKPVLLPKNENVRFYSGNVYIVLRTKVSRSGALQCDLHFWLGKDSSQDEGVAAALKAVELDAALGGRAVQYKEVQGQETDLFLSNFKPCFIPREGAAPSTPEQVDGAKQKPCLYLCRGSWIVRVEQVPFTRSSLNHTNVFILDMETKIFQFNGESSSMKERARALDVVQYINDNCHDGRCEVIIIDDGRLGDETNTGQFWGLFGGFAPLSKKKGTADDHELDIAVSKLFCIPAGDNSEKLEVQAASPRREILESSKCYVLDCGSDMYLWIGRTTTLDQRKAAALYAEKIIIRQLPGHIRMIKFMEGFETPAFQSKFDDWPSNASTTVPGEARGKFTALLKQQYISSKGPQSGSLLKEEPPSVLDSQGKIEIWRVSGDLKTSIPPPEHGKFFSGDCFIVQYTYPARNQKEDVFVYSWLGQLSSSSEQKVAEELCSKMNKNLKGRAVLGRIYEGKEPAHFLTLFAPMIVLKGRHPGSHKGSEQDTSPKLKIVLFEVRGSGSHNMQALQVNAVAGSLDSSRCFILQTDSKTFIWHGNCSTAENHQVALKIVETLQPGTSARILKEGSETEIFWKMVEGKRNHAGIPQSSDHAKDPLLFMCINTEGKMFLEIFNFNQDDLLSDDVFILDAHSEVFIWVGCNCTSEQKLGALNFGQTYIDHAVATDGLAPFTPLYQVAEGHEPLFFTRWFSWDAAKASVRPYLDLFKASAHRGEVLPLRVDELMQALSDSYKRKLAILQGYSYQAMKQSTRVSGGGNADPADQDCGVDPLSSSDSLCGQSQRAAALAGLSNALKTVDECRKDLGPRETEHGVLTQRATAMVALSSAWSSPSALKGVQDNTSPPLTEASPQRNMGVNLTPAPSTPKAASQRATAVAALSSMFDSSPKQLESQSASGNKMGFPKLDSAEEAVHDETPGEDFEGITSGESPDGFFSFSRLKVGSTNRPSHIDATRRESYLRKEEFEQLFGMTRQQFYELPQWKQAQKKKQLGLF